MLSAKSLQIIKNNSKILKELESIQEPHEQLAQTIEFVNKLSDAEDPYFKGYLYGLLINLYLKSSDSRNVVRYVNKLLLISGMALYEYSGNYCPFTKEKISQILNCYLQEEAAKNYSELWGKGRILHLQNKYTEALECYNKIIQNEKTSINTNRMCARLYEEMNDFSNALAFFEKAENIKQDSLTACMIANIYIKQYDFKKAKSILKNTIKTFPNNSYPEYRLIEVLNELGEKEEAKEKRKQLLKKNPGNTKYILHTITDYNENILQELQQLQECFSEGVLYTAVNEYLGNYYYQKSLLKTNSSNEEINSYQEEALDYYNKSIIQNNFRYQSYYNQIAILMKKTENILNTKKDDNVKRKALIKSFTDTFPYAIDDIYCFSNADASIEEQIKILEAARKEHPTKYSFYYYLALTYLQKSSYSELYKQKLIDLCQTQAEYFSTSFSVLFDCSVFCQKLELYELAYNYITKALKLCNNNKDVQLIAEQIKFFIEPNKFHQLIKETEKKFKNAINGRFYLNLSYFYFDKSYEYVTTNNHLLPNTPDYCQISLSLFEKAMTISEDVFTSKEVGLVYALLLYANHKNDKAHEIYNKINENQFLLLEQINVCGDIFDIHILYDLYSHKHKDEASCNIYFWTFVLLYLLRYNLFKDQKYTISHYTSIKALTSMLADKNMSSFRLCSLGSANDPKEGKVLYDYLARDIEDKNTYLNLINNQETNFTAVQASFTKLQDALTMFRLYGKKEKNEGTGINLVFNEHFFSNSLKTPLSKTEKIELKNDNSQKNINNEEDYGEPLYWILYWDKNSKMYFNPQGIYKTLEIDLNDNKIWTVLNQHQAELKTSPDTFYLKYAQNISFTLSQIKNEFQNYILTHNSLEDINNIKEILLNISYLIKDASFYDEKELRIIKLESIKEKDGLKHDDDYFTLYKDYSQLTGFYRYPNYCPLEKIIIGPKVEQKETLREYLLNHLGKAGMNSVVVEFSKAPLA